MAKLFKTVGTVLIVLLCVTAIAAGIIALIYLGNKDKPSANNGNQGTDTSKVIDKNGNTVDDGKTDENQGATEPGNAGNEGNASEEPGTEEPGTVTPGEEPGNAGEGTIDQPEVVSNEFALGKIVKEENNYYLELKNCNLDVAANSDARITVNMMHDAGNTVYRGTIQDFRVASVRSNYGVVDGVHNYINLNASGNAQVFIAKHFEDVYISVVYTDFDENRNKVVLKAEADYVFTYEDGAIEPQNPAIDLVLGDELVYYDHAYLLRVDGCDLSDPYATISVKAVAKTLVNDTVSSANYIAVKNFRSDYGVENGEYKYINLNHQVLKSVFNTINAKNGITAEVTVTYTKGNKKVSVTKSYDLSKAVIIPA